MQPLQPCNLGCRGTSRRDECKRERIGVRESLRIFASATETNATSWIFSQSAVGGARGIPAVTDRDRDLVKRAHYVAGTDWAWHPELHATRMIDRGIDNYWRLFVAGVFASEPEWDELLSAGTSRH
jgi:hypothetical protein